MVIHIQPRLYAPEEYLALEEVAEDKSEYVMGKLYPLRVAALTIIKSQATSMLI
ncbi:hypothetical protein [Leptothermofonsia sp. ETS-13]|uniref:hypothetical protein n=1 Tax=Leptothermofonsia sp. ETS-13 TaxID=3035696 RepID=UPI003BA2D13D